MRKIQFQNDYYYHIYNRGVDKRDVFMDEKDYIRFIVSMREFNRVEPIESLYRLNKLRCGEEKAAKLLRSSLAAPTPLVEIICYCMIPNHFHLSVKQICDNGITKFMHKLGYGHSRYFNIKYNRSGSLFQGTYQAIHINTDSYLLWLSGYINSNSEIHKIAKAEDWKWSSYQDYLGIRNGTLCNKNVILKDFNNIQEYKNLVDIIIKESSQRKDDIKKYLLE